LVDLSVCLVCVSLMRFVVVDGGRKRRGRGRRRVLKYPSKPLSPRLGRKVRERAFSIYMIIDVIPSSEAHPRLGASRTAEARGTSAGGGMRLLIGSLGDPPPRKVSKGSTS
jgi:hypothetical protein